MERTRIRSVMEIVVFAAVLFSVPKKIVSVIPARKPLCISQFALANHACGLVPYSGGLVQDVVEEPDDPESERRHHRNSSARERTSHGHGHEHEHGHGHEHNNEHVRRHGRSEPHHHHHHHLTQEEIDCCRWLKEMDDACVCQLLYRMPIFMRRPGHDFVVKVHDSCTVTFHCPGLVF